MEPVEHRRRRTRGRSADAHLGDAAGSPTVDVPQPRMRYRPGTSAVTPADIADRASSDRGSDHGDRSESTNAERPHRDRTHPDRSAVDRPGPDRPSERYAPDRHTPLDAHIAHPHHDDRDGERGLRGLVGGGSTQVNVAAAMRARDAARPTDEDIARAETSLTIVHRGWVPRDQS